MELSQDFQSIRQTVDELIAGESLSEKAGRVLQPAEREATRPRSIAWIDCDTERAAIRQVLKIESDLLTTQDVIKIVSSDQDASSGETPDIILPPEQALLLQGGHTLFVIQPWGENLVKGNVVRHLQDADAVLFSVAKSLTPPDVEAIQLAMSLGRSQNVGCLYAKNVAPEIMEANADLMARMNVDTYVLEDDDAETRLMTAIETAANAEAVAVIKSCVAELIPLIETASSLLQSHIETWQGDLKIRQTYEALRQKLQDLHTLTRTTKVKWRTELFAVGSEVKRIRRQLEADLNPYNGGNLIKKIIKYIDALKNSDLLGKKRLERTLSEIERLFNTETKAIIADAEVLLEAKVHTRVQDAVKTFAREHLSEFLGDDEIEDLRVECVRVDFPEPGIRMETWEVQAKLPKSRHIFTIVVSISIGVTTLGLLGSAGGPIGSGIGGFLGGVAGLFGGIKVIRDESAKVVKEKITGVVRSSLGEIRRQVADEMRSTAPVILQAMSDKHSDAIGDLQAAMENEIHAFKNVPNYSALQLETAVRDAEAEISKLEHLRVSVNEFSSQ